STTYTKQTATPQTCGDGFGGGEHCRIFSSIRATQLLKFPSCLNFSTHTIRYAIGYKLGKALHKDLLIVPSTIHPWVFLPPRTRGRTIHLRLLQLPLEGKLVV